MLASRSLPTDRASRSPAAAAVANALAAAAVVNALAAAAVASALAAAAVANALAAAVVVNALAAAAVAKKLAPRNDLFQVVATALMLRISNASRPAGQHVVTAIVLVRNVLKSDLGATWHWPPRVRHVCALKS